MDCHPSAQGAALSPSRHSNVKKVTGVGGTTYEISVWAGTPHPPMTHSGRSATEILLCYFNKITGSEGCIVPPPVYSSKSEDLFALLRVLFSYMPVCVCARGVGCRLLTLQCLSLIFCSPSSWTVQRDRQCFYRRLSSVFMKRLLFQMLHANFRSSERWGLNRNTTDRLNTWLATDFCKKTLFSWPQKVKVLHINLYCSCHVWWRCDGGLCGDDMCKGSKKKSNTSQMRNWRWWQGKSSAEQERVFLNPDMVIWLGKDCI